MNRFLLGLAVGLLIARPSNAEVILDQEVVTYPNTGYIGYILDYPGDYMAQSFTVHHTGQLVGVGVQVSIDQFSRPGGLPPIDDLHVRLVRTNSIGAPAINEVLAEATIDRDSLPTDYRPGPFTNVDFSSSHVQVTEGDVLAIALSSDQTYYSEPRVHTDGNDYIWYRSTRNEIPGGEFYYYSPLIFGPEPYKYVYVSGDDRTIDAGYRVFVNVVPEPGTLSLVAAALACLGLVRRR